MKVYEEKKRVILGRSVNENWFDLVKSILETEAKPNGETQFIDNIAKSVGNSVRKMLKEKNHINKDCAITLVRTPSLDRFPEEAFEVIVYDVDPAEIEGREVVPVKLESGKLILVVKDPVYVGLKQYKEREVR